MSEDKGGSKADTMVKVVLVFFISLLSFSVGTFVGKQVSDSDHRNLALEGVYNKGSREVASVDDKEDGGEEGSGGEKISEKEVENLTEEFVNKEKGREPAAAGESKSEGKAEGKGEKSEARAEKEEGGEKMSEAKAEKGEDEGATEAAPTEAKPREGGYKTFVRGKKVAGRESEREAEKAEDLSQVTEKVLEGKAPTDGKPETHKSAPRLPTVATGVIGKYGVQVVSLADEKDAKEYASNIKQKGFSSFYLPAKVKGKTWYRVMVGPYDSLKSAEDARAQIVTDLKVTGPLVQKIVQ